ncbi:peptidoglycan-binding domain-containing protein [Alkalihalobacillus sp. 1P02AB]|uniref:peptidoglycan-binding domain-containing protein n=1 Tax=Alkalihalobacillus sp. 1P02AB TaxID=3132260 RepID=UPI0039A5AEA9
MQTALNAVNFNPGAVDGIYGPKTADVLRRFQSMHGLVADGIYGPATRAKLLAVMQA